MKSDKNGVSQCQVGHESWETYFSGLKQKEMVQYDYRHTDGSLFSTIAPTLDVAREKRDAWLSKNYVVETGS
jgi:hypothetical protein